MISAKFGGLTLRFVDNLNIDSHQLIISNSYFTSIMYLPYIYSYFF